MIRQAIAATAAVLACVAIVACRPTPDSSAPNARNLLLVTIDTLRADHVRAYGYARSQASFVDAVASAGSVFERAYAAAPITLPSHATILTGRYPPGHGSRDNGMRMSEKIPTLATELKARGFRTAAFVAAFPLDHQFGLSRGFDVYSDRLPRDRSGKLASERPAKDVVDEAVAWIEANGSGRSEAAARFFVWVHVFEPHAPYGNPGDGRPVLERYDVDIGTANRELLRLLNPLGRHPDTLIIVAGDHGEAFGEHGEYSHSIFVYDTTLRVPLAMSGGGVPARKQGDDRGALISAPVTLADVAPTAMRMMGFMMPDVDGIDLSPALKGGPLPARKIYAESFAPLVEFGWAPLRSIRSGQWKYIAAPQPELYDLDADGGERTNVHAARQDVAQTLEREVSRYSGDALDTNALGLRGDAAERLRALGYSAGNQQSSIRTPQSAIRNGARPDPKERRELAARIAQVTSGELSGPALLAALEAIVRDDPGNGQAHLRLGYARIQSGDCAGAEREFHAAIASGLPAVDAFLGLAGCLGARRDYAGAATALEQARRLEPDNPVVLANIGILKATRGDSAGAIDLLQTALNADPDLHEARFNLALTYARSGRMAEARTAATELLRRLPSDAPQRAEVERLIKAVSAQPSK